MARSSGPVCLGAAALLSLGLAGLAFPVHGQAVNQLGLCTLSGASINALQADVDDDVGSENAEVAFVVVYSLNNDNNGQEVGGGTTGPILCTNPNVVDSPIPTAADANIANIDILDSAEAFLLRYEGAGGSTDPETRFCHTTNGNVDCVLLQPQFGE